MHQKNPIHTSHNDLVTDAAYDFYGQRLATGSVDQHIKVWGIDGKGTWTEQDSWKAHDATITKLSWAHPEFGYVLASCSFDRVVKIWEQTAPEPDAATVPGAPGSAQRWVERTSLVDARGSVRAIEFAPHHFGLKLASISADNYLRVYECLEQPALTSWQLLEDIDVSALRGASSGSSELDGSVLGAASSANLLGADAHSAPAGASASPASMGGPSTLSTEPGTLPGSRPGGNKEADGGWSVSWCRDHYWGEVLAIAAGTDGLVKIVKLSPSRRPVAVLTLDSSPPSSSPTQRARPPTYSITSVAWAPSCGRSYHLVATGSRDGRVRVWKVKPPPLNDELAELAATMEGIDQGSWTASVVADFDQHKSLVNRVEWNITGTMLASTGNDGKVRIWKSTLGGVWRPSGYVSVEAAEQDGDADMDGDTE